jgi:hypothetical protein
VGRNLKLQKALKISKEPFKISAIQLFQFDTPASTQFNAAELKNSSLLASQSTLTNVSS